MRVLLDATAIPPNLGGVGRYVEALLPELANDGVELAVVCQSRDAERLAALAPQARMVSAPRATESRAARLVWEQTGLPGLVRSLGAQVLHSPHYTMPRLSPVPVVVTLHDATFFSHPEMHSGIKREFFRRATRVAVERAARLIVPSAATRDGVLAAVGGAPRSFFVAYHGVDRSVFHPVAAAERDRVAEVIGVAPADPYIAFLGTLEPRKNVPALIRAWVSVMAEQTQKLPLVIAGGPGWDEDVPAAIASVPKDLTLRKVGYLPLEDLSGFLSGAQIVAYPSHAEGFGLPVLEAMACGACVLTTRELSLPEVGGDAVAYCEPGEASIANALGELLAAPRRRADLGVAAKARAEGFTWAASAEAHRRAYHAALQQAS